jgi:hypothetical protein
MKNYCYYCDKDVEYTVKEKEINLNIRGKETKDSGSKA